MNNAFLFADMEAVTTAERRESRASERRRKARAAYTATSSVWKKATYRFAVEEFLPDHATFMFEELTMAYAEAVKTEALPATVNGKAFAGLQRILVTEGKIELIPGITRMRSNSQAGLVYRSKLCQL